MFEFGRDLRRLFAQARESEDLGWLELVGVNLLAAEARREATDAGRVSCRRPLPVWLRASSLWREHARRTGARDSLRRAEDAATDARKAAVQDHERALAAAALAEVHLLRFDLGGGLDRLARAEALVGSAPGSCRAVAAAHARLKARQAGLTPEAPGLMEAAALLDAALHGALDCPAPEADALRLDRAGLALQAGVQRRDARLLDQAGRDLSALISATPGDQRPLTRARALTLCASGLSALAVLADDGMAAAQAQTLFDAAADQFTPDHSPLDWVAVQLARAARGQVVAPALLREAERLTAGQDLILGALAREMRIEAESERAAPAELDRLEAAVRRRLAADAMGPLDWAAEQVAMAHLEQARGVVGEWIGLALMEAAQAAAEAGAPAVAALAEAVRLRATRPQRAGAEPLATKGPFRKPGLP